MEIRAFTRPQPAFFRAREAQEPLDRLAEQAAEAGAEFRMQRRVRLPWMSPWKSVHPHEVARELSHGPSERLQVIPQPGMASLPLKTGEDLEELATLPAREGGLQSLAQRGWRFYAENLEVGLYGAYNGLTESKSVEARYQDRKVPLDSLETAAELATFLTEPARLGPRAAAIAGLNGPFGVDPFVAHRTPGCKLNGWVPLDEIRWSTPAWRLDVARAEKLEKAAGPGPETLTAWRLLQQDKRLQAAGVQPAIGRLMLEELKLDYALSLDVQDSHTVCLTALQDPEATPIELSRKLLDRLGPEDGPKVGAAALEHIPDPERARRLLEGLDASRTAVYKVVLDQKPLPADLLTEKRADSDQLARNLMRERKQDELLKLAEQARQPDTARKLALGQNPATVIRDQKDAGAGAALLGTLSDPVAALGLEAYAAHPEWSTVGAALDHLGQPVEKAAAAMMSARAGPAILQHLAPGAPAVEMAVATARDLDDKGQLHCYATTLRHLEAKTPAELTRLAEELASGLQDQADVVYTRLLERLKEEPSLKAPLELALSCMEDTDPITRARMADLALKHSAESAVTLGGHLIQAAMGHQRNQVAARVLDALQQDPATRPMAELGKKVGELVEDGPARARLYGEVLAGCQGMTPLALAALGVKVLDAIGIERNPEKARQAGDMFLSELKVDQTSFDPHTAAKILLKDEVTPEAAPAHLCRAVLERLANGESLDDLMRPEVVGGIKDGSDHVDIGGVRVPKRG